jgi:hypothetical protein
VVTGILEELAASIFRIRYPKNGGSVSVLFQPPEFRLSFPTQPYLLLYRGSLQSVPHPQIFLTLPRSPPCFLCMQLVLVYLPDRSTCMSQSWSLQMKLITDTQVSGRNSFTVNAYNFMRSDINIYNSQSHKNYHSVKPLKIGINFERKKKTRQANARIT